MTDKQIIIYKKECYNEPYCSLNQVLEQLKAKEQECEELKKELHKNFEEKDTLHLIIDRLLEASGYDTNTASAEDFEDVYEHMRYEQQQLDQLKEQLEAYKMEAEEGKEINAELKAENDNLKSLIWWIHVGAEGADKATTEYYENRNTPYEENYWKRIRALQSPTYESKYKLALTEIKEIAKNRSNYPCGKCIKIEILQKISEVEE